MRRALSPSTSARRAIATPRSRTRRSPGEDELAIVFRVARGPLFRVGRVEISGNASLPLTTIAPLVRAREGEPFVESQLDTDIEAIVSVYRRAGFPDVKVRSAVVPEPGRAGHRSHSAVD